MNTEAQAIIDELRAAFPAKRPLLCFSLSNSSQETEPIEVEREFRDKDDWTVLASHWLDTVPSGLASALSFLSDEAVCFYLPAFLVADIEDRLERVEPVFYLCHGFEIHSYERPSKVSGAPAGYTWTHYAHERWERLTSNQVLAIVHYLEWSARKTQIYSEPIRQALSVYWYERAAQCK